jgi:hypothetical protein
MIIKGKLIDLLAVELEKSITAEDEKGIGEEVSEIFMKGEYIEFDSEQDLTLFELSYNIIVSRILIIKLKKK